MRKKLLITDDDDEMRGEIAEIMRDEGFDTDTAVNGLAAIKALEKHKYDLLILDLKMPVMSGFEVLRQIGEKNIKIKVIVLTGSVLDSDTLDETPAADRESLKRADAVMNKPFQIDALLEKARSLTRGKK